MAEPILVAQSKEPIFLLPKMANCHGLIAWLRMLDNPDILFRFDVAEVILGNDAIPRVEPIKNALPLSKPYLY